MNLSEFFRASGSGSQKKMAFAIGATEADISNFKKGIRVTPVKYCKAIERYTDGQVTVRDLRPDDWQDYWDK